MKRVTYRMIRFTAVNRYVAVAWNYDHAVLIATSDHATYTEARAELDKLCTERNVQLQWFDGEYTCDGEGYSLEPIE